MTHITPMLKRCFRAGLWFALLTSVGACTLTQGDQVAGMPTVEESPPTEPPLAGSPGSGEPAAKPVALRSGHPQRYVVKPDDTRWDIAKVFLERPWRWQEVWRPHQNLENSNAIYPGNDVELYYEDGQPRLRLASDQRGAERPIVKLSPQVRVESLPEPITTLPRSATKPFMTENRVMSAAEWALAPYVVGNPDARLFTVTGDLVYARGANFDQPIYRLFRPQKEYRDPSTGRFLGYEAVYVGEAVLVKDADPAILKLSRVKQGARPGDRLFAAEDLDQDEIADLMPRPAGSDVEGHIIDVLGGTFLVGRNQTVVLNLGEIDEVEPGHVLEVYNTGQPIVDLLTQEQIKLPDKQAGLMMVYKVFEEASYALVTEASHPIRLYDRVRNPESSAY